MGLKLSLMLIFLIIGLLPPLKDLCHECPPHSRRDKSRTRRILDAVYGQSTIQSESEAFGARQRNVLLDRGWSRGARRGRGTVVRERGTWAARDYRGGHEAALDHGICADFSNAPADRIRTRKTPGQNCAPGACSTLLQQFRFRGR